MPSEGTPALPAWTDGRTHLQTGSAAAGAGGRGSSRSRGSSRWWWRPRPRRGSRPRRCPLWSWDLDKEQVSSPSSLTLAWTPGQRRGAPASGPRFPEGRAASRAAASQEGLWCAPKSTAEQPGPQHRRPPGRAHLSNGAVSRSPPPHTCSVSLPPPKTSLRAPFVRPLRATRDLSSPRSHSC